MFARILVKIVLTALFAALPIASMSAAGDEDEYGVPIVVVDWTSLHRSGARAEGWVTRSFPEPIMLGHDTYLHRSQKLQYAIACADRTYALVQWVLTDAAEGQGNTVWADRAVSLDYLHPVKGTLEAAFVHAACEADPASAVARTPNRANTPE